MRMVLYSDYKCYGLVRKVSRFIIIIANASDACRVAWRRIRNLDYWIIGGGQPCHNVREIATLRRGIRPRPLS